MAKVRIRNVEPEWLTPRKKNMAVSGFGEERFVEYAKKHGIKTVYAQAIHSPHKGRGMKRTGYYAVPKPRKRKRK